MGLVKGARRRSAVSEEPLDCYSEQTRTLEARARDSAFGAYIEDKIFIFIGDTHKFVYISYVKSRIFTGRGMCQFADQERAQMQDSYASSITLNTKLMLQRIS